MDKIECTYGNEGCTSEFSNDYDMMCDECRGDYGANIADMRDDRD